MKLEIQDLHASIEGKEILKGVTLTINPGEIHALMGPNGSGKSTLANVLMGHPKYEVTKGKILLNGENISEMEPDERAKKGLFLSFQYPVEIPGVTVENFLRTAVNNVQGKDLDVVEFHELLKKTLADFGIKNEFAGRYLNEGFSGGEKKRMEILQMLLLNPTFAILDETDSGLDVDALKIVSDGINKIKDEKHGVLLITHYNRILEYVIPDKVHVLIDGKITETGGKELAHTIEAEGYER
ncbi:MAG: Fe-S cluster assembly ATPase SufC [Candidatus Woesearchaeota archaeon]|nr:Fe-S cluster assembly ATPase SufC [Candidatus Woesearchaeota archaeon]